VLGQPGYPPVAPTGASVTTPQPGAAYPAVPAPHDSSAYPATCSRCGSNKIMANVQLTVVGGGAVVMLTPAGDRAILTASVCGQCGLVQLNADSPKLLWAALRG
jgi:ribosomal protein S27AE